MKRVVLVHMAGVLGILTLLGGWQGIAIAQEKALVLEDFRTKDAEGFPLLWDHENQRSKSKGREAYKIWSENGADYLSAKDAGQRIKKKKID